MALQPATNNANVVIFDVGGTPLFDDGHGGIVDRAGVVQNVDVQGNPVDAGGAAILQPANPMVRLFAYVAEQQRALTNATLGLVAAAHPAAPAAVAFARNPGRLNRNVLDYATKQGSILYENAKKALYSDTELYALQTVGLSGFLDQVE